MAKPTAAQKKIRIRAVYEMLLGNYPRPDILQYCAEKWGVKERGADYYIAEATALIEQEAAKHQSHYFELNLQQRHYLHNKAVKDSDWRLAHEIIKDEAKLLDLYPAEKKSNFNIDLSDLDDNQLERIAGGENILTVLATSSES